MPVLPWGLQSEIPAVVLVGEDGLLLITARLFREDLIIKTTIPNSISNENDFIICKKEKN
jgi:hypothetical protein